MSEKTSGTTGGAQSAADASGAMGARTAAGAQGAQTAAGPRPSAFLSLTRLPWRNLTGYPARTAALVVFSMLMAIAVFGGAMVIQGVQTGLATVQNRLGADIIVTPEDTNEQFDAQTVLLQAEPGYFYMDASVLDEVAAVDGVSQVSAQLFLASAKSSCCSARLQIIAFDPDTDFAIQPWIADTLGSADAVGDMDVIVGSNVTVYDSGLITFFDTDYRIVGQFAPTGSTLDNAVYMTFDTYESVLKGSFEKSLNAYGEFDPSNVISSVSVRVADDADIDEVAAAITESVNGVSVATSTAMVSGIADSMSAISATVGVLIAVIWVIALVMIILIFTMLINERRREFAALSAMGASRRQIGRLVVAEALMVNLGGSIIGIVAAGVVLGSFTVLIGQALGVGFVLPSWPVTLGLAAAALVSALVAAAVSSWIGVHRLNSMDVSLVLKEGE